MPIRTRTYALLAATILVSACQNPAPPAAQPVETPLPQPPPRTVAPEPVAAPLLHKVVVVAGESAPGTEQIEAAVGDALTRQGVKAISGPRPEQAHLMLVVWCAMRPAGQWGGIPSQEATLSYALLDARSHSRLAGGREASSYADPGVEAARAGALRAAAAGVARRLVGAIRQLPAPPPTPEAAPASGEVKPVSVAVLPFHNGTTRADLTGWCETLSAVGVQALVASGRYRVIERARLGEVIKEEDLSAAFGAGAGALSGIGRQLGVDLLTVGELAVRPDGQLSLTARFIQSSDAQVVRVIMVSAPAAQAGQMEQQLRRQLSRQVDDWISAEIDRLQKAAGPAPVRR